MGTVLTIQEIKDFIVWAKEQGAVHIKVDNVEVSISPSQALPKAAQDIADRYWKELSNPKIDEMSLENPLLFDAVK